MKSVNKNQILEGLKELSVKPGDTVEVHSSLSSFGRIQGGSAAMVDALMEAVGPNGSLVMSAYRVSPSYPLSLKEKMLGIKWKVKVLPEKSTDKTGMGAIVEEFSRRPGVVLGKGLHRNAAWGKDARLLSRGYDYLLNRDGLVLLLGVGIDRCSSLHLAEQSVPLPTEIEAIFEVPQRLKKIYPENIWQIGYGETPRDPWQEVYQEADKKGLVRHRRIGLAECHLFKANAVVSILKHRRKNNPYQLYGFTHR